jgi:hypothetical protein
VVFTGDVLQQAEPMMSEFARMFVLLSRRDSIDLQTFSKYWRDIHGPLASRFPGMGYYVQHYLTYAGDWWPLATTPVSAADMVDGIAELHYATGEDLDRYRAASRPVLEDEPNVFRRSTRYICDHLTVLPAVEARPESCEQSAGGTSFLALVRRCTDVDDATFGHFVRQELAPRWTAERDVEQVRAVTLLERDNTQNHTLSKNVDHDAPAERQYQGLIELVFASAVAARRFFASEAFLATAGAQARHFREVHLYRSLEAVVMVRDGSPTLSGLRGDSIARLISELGAVNQLQGEICNLFAAASTLRGPISSDRSISKRQDQV